MALTPEPESKWQSLRGMTESQAESWMAQNWGSIPDQWLDPIFRDEVTGCAGQAEIQAHLDLGEQAYVSSLGDQARGIWATRNIWGQGHPVTSLGGTLLGKLSSGLL